MNTTTVDVTDEGKGPGLLFLHAGIADRRMWAEQVAYYRPSYRVLAPDLRGFGVSPTASEPFAHHADLRALLDHLDVENVVVIGNSYGGNVALDFAIAAPERVSGLVLVSTLAGMDEPSAVLREAWTMAEERFRAGDLDGARDVELAAWIDAGRTADQIDSAFREMAGVMIRGVWERAANDPEPVDELELDPPAIERLHELTVPVLLVQGDHDLPDVAPSMARLAYGIPHARSVEIANASHLVPMERPEPFNVVLTDFLEAL